MSTFLCGVGTSYGDFAKPFVLRAMPPPPFCKGFSFMTALNSSCSLTKRESDNFPLNQKPENSWHCVLRARQPVKCGLQYIHHRPEHTSTSLDEQHLNWCQQAHPDKCWVHCFHAHHCHHPVSNCSSARSLSFVQIQGSTSRPLLASREMWVKQQHQGQYQLQANVTIYITYWNTQLPPFRVCQPGTHKEYQILCFSFLHCEYVWTDGPIWRTLTACWGCMHSSSKTPK